MVNVISVIFLILFIALVVGLINPRLIIRWGEEGDKNRISVIITFFIAMTALSIFIAIFMDDVYMENTSDKKQSKEILKEQNIEEKSKESTVDKEKSSEKKEIKEKEFVFDHEYVTSSNSMINSKLAAKYFIEEYDKQKVKEIKVESVSIYSDKPVRDQSGKDYPYSTMVLGRYEEKNTGALRDFIMTLVYDNLDNVEEGLARCAQYFNDDTGTYINRMHEEDDVVLKLIEAMQ